MPGNGSTPGGYPSVTNLSGRATADQVVAEAVLRAEPQLSVSLTEAGRRRLHQAAARRISSCLLRHRAREPDRLLRPSQVFARRRGGWVVLAFGTTGTMKLYVCWGTFPVPWPRSGDSWKPGAHPCKRAYDALRQAGHEPEVIRVYGLAPLPDITKGRREVKRLTGESFVPVLVLDDGEVISDSKTIAAWAQANPAHPST